MTEQHLTLAELAGRSGIPPRTIRFYISRGLLEGPLRAGRGAAYTAAHLERLAYIRKLQAEGRSLAEIAPLLAGSSHTIEAAPWWQYRIADDVIVWASAGASPWRAKQIRALVGEMAARLSAATKEEEE